MIKLTNYPYKDFAVGQICDFGQEKNASLVAMSRAVWVEEPKTLFRKSPAEVASEQSAPVKSSAEGTTEAASEDKVLEQKVVEVEDEKTSEVSSPTAPKKKIFQNKLREKVSQKSQTDAKSFWDRLK